MLSIVGRLIGKVQRLRQVDNRLAELRDEVRSLREANERLTGELAQAFHDQIARLRAEDRARDENDPASPRRLKEQLDLFKSRVEVGPELFAEFQRWKAANPVAAEPLVSVCVATYNRGRLLTERCIPSLLGQTYRKLELIVIGDGCTDDTAERVAAIRDPRLRFVNRAARGEYPSDKWRRWMVAGCAPANEALAAARGDFITHLDDDDEHVPDRVEKLVAFAAEGNHDFVWHPFWWETRPGFWEVNEAPEMELGQVTTSAIFYRGWFKCLPWDVRSHLLGEPGDWNRFRKIKYLGADCARYPEPLLRHYMERSREEWQPAAA